MQKKPNKQLIIIGGGSSINEGIEQDLWNKLVGKYTVSCNYVYRYMYPTIQTSVDDKFYHAEREELKKLPFIVCQAYRKLNPEPNTITLKCAAKWYRNLNPGVYKASLVGIFALSLGIYLLNEGEIYLLGYDFGEVRESDYEKNIKSPQTLRQIAKRDKNGKFLTHFYQGDIKHRGIGKITYYNEHNRAERDYGVYKNEKKVKIYNVSLISKIPSSIFPKISYDEFFERLDDKKYDQDELREEVQKKLRKVPS